jgi:drug/metabolite transporter (DMT)-like permease
MARAPLIAETESRSSKLPPLSRRFKILAAFAAIYVIWGSTYLGIRIAIETMPPLIMAGARYASAGALLFAWTLARGKERPRPVHWWSAVVIGALLLLGGNGAVSWAELRVPTGIAALMIASVPLWIVVLDWLRPGGRRPGVWVIAGLALGIAGLWFLAGPVGHAAGPRPDPLGVIVLVLGALAWSMGSVYSRHAPLPASPLLGIALEMLCGGVLLVVAGIVLGEGAHFDPARISLRSLVAFAYLVLLGSLVGFTCYVWLLRVSTPARVSTYAFVNPVVAVALGWGLLGEAVTPRILTSSVVVVVAVAVITLMAPRHD